MSKIFDDRVSEERKDYSYKMPMNTMKDVEDNLDVLLRYLHEMIYDNCESDKRAEEVCQEIATDIFIPAIKNAYQDAVNYLLWGSPHVRQGRISRYGTGYAPKRDYQYTDEEREENTEDED